MVFAFFIFVVKNCMILMRVCYLHSPLFLFGSYILLQEGEMKSFCEQMNANQQLMEPQLLFKKNGKSLTYGRSAVAAHCKRL